jgi:hypothetical protein
MGVKVTVPSLKRFVGLLPFLVFYLLTASPRPPAAQEESATSSDPRRWRPTQQTASRSYVRAAVCAECHVAIFRSQSATPMAAALKPASDSAILQAHPRLVFQSGRFSYLIARLGRQTIFTVTDGAESISATIL